MEGFDIKKAFIGIFNILLMMIFVSNLVFAQAKEKPLKSGETFQFINTLKSENKVVMDNIGFGRSNYQDKQALGIILPANEELIIKQINPNFNQDLKIEFLNDFKENESSAIIPKGCETVYLKNSNLSVPFIVTPYTTSKEKPIIQYEIKSSMKKLPSYSLGENEESFFKFWDLNNSDFAILKSGFVQFLIPVIDRDNLRNMEDFKSIDELLNYYKTMIQLYDKVAGVSESDFSIVNRINKVRFFIKADFDKINGGAYYINDYIADAQNYSVNSFLKKSWTSCHEIAHGYQGIFIYDKEGLELNEVWNNIYARIFEEKYLNENISWLYGKDRKLIQNDIYNKIVIEKRSFGDLLVNEKLYFFIKIYEKFGYGPFVYFNKTYREMSIKENMSLYINSDILALLLSFGCKADLVPYFESYGIKISDFVKQQTSILSVEKLGI